MQFCSLPGMPKRGRVLHHTGVCPGSGLETIESMRRRLCPSAGPTLPPRPPAPPMPSGTTGAGIPASSSVAAVPTRRDAPVVRNLQRGSVPATVASLELYGADALMQDLVRDKDAKSCIAPGNSHLKLWAHFHGIVYPTQPPPVWPITVESLQRVASLFKGGGYRSYENYRDAAKRRHIELGHYWTQQLDHTNKWVTRSVLRGIGPARQSCPFHFKRLVNLPRNMQPLVPDGPQCPIHMALLGCLFLLREIEASTAYLSAISFNTQDLEVSWQLPSSKTDHLALGTVRTLPCLCDLTDFACPYHVALEVKQWHAAQPGYSVDREVPLFPTRSGLHPAKARVVDTFEVIGTMTGLPLRSPAGMRLFGGHTTRVTGSREYAARGMEVNKVRILARHSGDMILRYVQDTPLRKLRGDLGLTGSRPGLSTALPFGPAATGQSTARMRERLRKLEAELVRMQAEIQRQACEVVGIATGFARTDQRVFIQNTTTKAIHYAIANNSRSTVCGWAFKAANRGGKSYRVVPNLVNMPGHLLCEHCLLTERLISLGTNCTAHDISGDER